MRKGCTAWKICAGRMDRTALGADSWRGHIGTEAECRLRQRRVRRRRKQDVEYRVKLKLKMRMRRLRFRRQLTVVHWPHAKRMLTTPSAPGSME